MGGEKGVRADEGLSHSELVTKKDSSLSAYADWQQSGERGLFWKQPLWTVMPNREGTFPTPHSHTHIHTRARAHIQASRTCASFPFTPTHTHTIHRQACTRHRPVPARVLQKYSASRLAALTWPRLWQIRAWQCLRARREDAAAGAMMSV